MPAYATPESDLSSLVGKPIKFYYGCNSEAQAKYALDGIVLGWTRTRNGDLGLVIADRSMGLDDEGLYKLAVISLWEHSAWMAPSDSPHPPSDKIVGWCDAPEDRLYHAADRTWWRRDGTRLVAAESPAESLGLKLAAAEQVVQAFKLAGAGAVEYDGLLLAIKHLQAQFVVKDLQVRMQET